MHTSQHENQTQLKVISWNINGLKEKLKDAKKTKKLQNMFAVYDIVLLQETHLGKKNDNEKKLATKGDEEVNNSEGVMSGTDSENQDEEKVSDFFKECGCIVETLQNSSYQDNQDSKEPTIYITNFSSKSRGVAILVNKQHKCLKKKYDGGDYAWVYVEIDKQKYTFVSVYYHSKEKSNVMLRILCSFLTHGSEVFQRPIIGGDFNTTLHYRLDKKSVKDSTVHKSRRKSILEIMKILRLEDVWRKKHPCEKLYTFSCKKPMSRLDYVFMLKKDLPHVQNCDIWQDEDIDPELSDHYPIKLTLTI